MSYLAQTFATLRGFYLFLVSTEKDRKMSELKFAMMVLFGASINLQESVEKYEKKVRRARGYKKEMWESLVLSLSNFYCRLRMVKYLFINTQSLRSLKKRKKYENLEHFVARGLEVLKTDGREELYRLKLPPNTNCVICGTNLGDRAAKRCIKLPNQVVWPKENNMAAVLQLKTICGDGGGDHSFKLPLDITYPNAIVANTMASVLKMKNKSLITCGRHSCNTDAEAVYNLSLFLEGFGLSKFLADSRICHGCSKYSLKTHRCSRCRLTRYCSQDCFNINWRDHSVRCEPYVRPGTEDLFVSKKLDGEAKQNHGLQCSIISSDPYIASAQIFVKNM